MPILPILVFSFVVALSLDIYIRFKLRADDDQKKVLSLLEKINNIIASSITNVDTVAQQVSDAVAFDLGFQVGVILLIDEKRKILKRVAISRTERVYKAAKEIGIEFKGLETPLSDTNNMTVQVALDGIPRTTGAIYELLRPHATLDQAAYIQKVGELSSSLVYPLVGKKGRIGVMIISLSRFRKTLNDVQKVLIQKVIDVVGIALDNAMLYENLASISQELKGANVKLMEMDKLKDDFVSVTSHELRTPMTAIRSYAWMALHRSDIPLSKTMEKYLVRVLISTERLINLVNDMLNISRIESGRIEINPEPVDLISLCRDIMDEVYYSKGTDKNINFQLAEQSIPKVFADPEKLRQVLLNIIGNALKFSPLGGKITIGLLVNGEMIDIFVKDEGPGISQEDMGRLFKKFGRLDSSYVASATSGGTGLGLYISKALVELMHGHIRAQSEGLGKGATFTVSLPIASEQVIKEAEKYTVKVKGEIKELETTAI